MNAPTLDRATYLGGSDIAGVLGLSPWDTPLTIFYKKTGWPIGQEPTIEPARERAFARGKRLEPIALDMLRDEYGVRIVKRSTEIKPNRYQDSEHPFFAAEIDFECMVTPELHEAYPAFSDVPVGTRINGEVKSSHPFVAGKKFGESQTDEIPVEYAAQCLWGQMVTGRKHTLVAVLVGADNLLTYRIDYDAETVAAMRTKALTFWREHVLTGIPPDPLRLEDIYRLFARDHSTKIEANEEIALLAKEHIQLGSEASSIEERRKELKFQIGIYLLGGERVANPEPTQTHVLMWEGLPLLQVAYRSAQRIDQKKLEEAYPEIAAACRKESRYFEYRKAPKPKRKAA